MGKLFSMQGRMSRLQYFLTSMAIGVVTYAIAFALGFVMGMTGANENLAGFAGFALGLIGAIVQGCLVVKRLHDLNRPGKHYWLLIIPLYNFYIALVLLFQKGSEGANQYGQDPVAA